MQQLLGPETFEFLAKFFLAGWLFLSARSWWVRGERPKPNEVIFEAITLSLINQLLALLTVPLLAATLKPDNELILLLVEVFGQPVLLGVVVGWMAQQDFLPDGVRRLFMPAVVPVTDTFDFSFARLENPTFLILNYSDGRTIYGYFGEKSLANNTGEGGGIFLESLFNLEDGGEWVAADPRRSAWINIEGLHSVEMISSKDL